MERDLLLWTLHRLPAGPDAVLCALLPFVTPEETLILNMHMVVNLSNPPSGDNLYQMKEGEEEEVKEVIGRIWGGKEICLNNLTKYHFIFPGRAKNPKHIHKDEGTQSTYLYLTWHAENKPHFENNQTAAQQKHSTNHPFQPLFLDAS